MNLQGAVGPIVGLDNMPLVAACVSTGLIACCIVFAIWFIRRAERRD